MTEVVGIITALAKALPELEGAKKRSLNPHFKNRYADLGAVMEAIEPIAEHGLWYRQIMLECDSGIKLETRYICVGDQELSAGILFMPALKNDPQAYGSALSYCKRYSLQCAFGLASEDDDAEAAAKGIRRVREQPQAQQQSSAPTGKLDGPYPSKSALDKAFKTFYRELQGCGDSGEFEGLLATKEARELINQIRRDWPALFEGGEGLPEEYVPLKDYVNQRRRDFEMLEQNGG